MKKNKNSFWEFFASVKLALFCFFTLAFASIAGTIIPQNESPAVYVQKYGETTAEIFRLLNIPDMYHAWWFLSLLSLFSINLIVCSLDRLPTVWKMVMMDNLETKVDRLEKMSPRVRFGTVQPKQNVTAQLEETLHFPVYWKIPNDYPTVIDAVNSGLPIEEVGAESEVAQCYRNMAADLAGIEIEQTTQSGGLFSKLLGRK